MKSVLEKPLPPVALTPSPCPWYVPGASPVLGKFEGIRLQHRLPDLILADRLARGRVCSAPCRRRRDRAVVEVGPMGCIGERILQLGHLRARGAIVAAAIVVRVAMAIARSKPRAEACGETILSRLFARFCAPRLPLHRTLRPMSFTRLVLGRIGVERRRSGVNLARGERTGAGMPPALRNVHGVDTTAHETGMVRHSFMDIRVVIALDPSVDPKDERDP